MKRVSLKLGLAASMLAGGWVCAEEPATPAAPAGAPPPAEAQAQTSAPKIACDEPLFDFGSVESVQTVEHTFIIKNAGTAPLEIINARPSCGCTVANVSEKIVAPGGQSEVAAKLSLAGRHGQQYKTITIESNDPNNRQMMLTLKGDVSSAVDVQPDRIMFGQVKPGGVMTQEVQIVATGTNTVKVLKAESTSPVFVPEIIPVEENKSYRLVVRTQQTLQPGQIAGFINVETDNASRRTFNVQVVATIMGEIIVAPAEVLLTQQSAQPVTRYIILRPGTLQSFEISAVEPPVADMKVQVLPFAGNGYRIQVDNIAATPELQGQALTIRTSAELMKEIKVPFRVIGAPQAPAQPVPPVAPPPATS
jgi:hypothetical protein